MRDEKIDEVADDLVWLVPQASATVAQLGPLLEFDAEDLEYTDAIETLGDGCFELDSDANRRNRVNTLCGDVLPNHDDLFVISPRLHALLVEENLPEIVFLDVQIFHGRTLFEGYKVVHFRKHVGCINEEESTLTYNESHPNFIWHVDNLTLDITKTRGRKMFKVNGIASAVFMRRSFAQKLVAAGFEGFIIAEVADFE